MPTKNLISILGYDVFAGHKKYFADRVTGVISTLNPHSYVMARKDDQFRDALQAADWLLPDGVGIKYAAYLLYGTKIEKIAGADLHEMVLVSLSERGGSCFYLGSSKETLGKIKERMAQEYPSVKVGVFSPSYREAFTEEENSEMINAVNSFSPDVLFVGMTAPKQEKWVHENRSKLNVPLICSIGAAFDFYAGAIKRSGKFWIKLGLEWLPRFLREPGRLWKRNLISAPLFLWHVGIEKVDKLVKPKYHSFVRPTHRHGDQD